jgi:multidrug efflux pump subunit AcrA (membrane-fusion protein)
MWHRFGPGPFTVLRTIAQKPPCLAYHSNARRLGWKALLKKALCFSILVAAGCQQGRPKIAPPETPVVPVSHPLAREVTDYVDFTGRTDPIDALNVVPRVTGYLVRMPFKEGSEVKKGDLLFEIDPRPYQAQLDQAEGQVKLYQAQLELARTTLARDTEINKTPGAVSAQQLDQDRAAVADVSFLFEISSPKR